MNFYYYYWPGDWDGDGLTPDHFISIRKSYTDSLSLPEHVRQKIDEALDDGNLSDGLLQMLNGLYFDYTITR